MTRCKVDYSQVHHHVSPADSSDVWWLTKVCHVGAISCVLVQPTCAKRLPCSWPSTASSILLHMLLLMLSFFVLGGSFVGIVSVSEGECLILLSLQAQNN